MKTKISSRIDDNLVERMKQAVSEGKYKNTTALIEDGIRYCTGKHIPTQKVQISINQAISYIDTIETKIEIMGVYPELVSDLKETKDILRGVILL